MQGLIPTRGSFADIATSRRQGAQNYLNMVRPNSRTRQETDEDEKGPGGAIMAGAGGAAGGFMVGGPVGAVIGGIAGIGAYMMG